MPSHSKSLIQSPYQAWHLDCRAFTSGHAAASLHWELSVLKSQVLCLPHPMGKVEQKHDNNNKHLPRRIVRQKTVTVPQQFWNISEESCKNSCSKSRECYSFNSFWLIPGIAPKFIVPHGSWLCSLGCSPFPIILLGHKNRAWEDIPLLEAK